MEEWEIDDVPERRAKQSDYGWVIWLVAGVVAIGAGAWYFWPRHEDVKPVVEPPHVVDEPPVAVAPPETPDTGMPAAPPRPQVNGDDLLRKLAQRGSSSGMLEVWLSSPDIVQRIAAAVRLIGDGKSPRPVLAFIELEGDFDASEDKSGRMTVTPASYARYDAMTKALTSMEPGYAAQAYRQLRPYFETIFSQVARPGERFDDAFGAAIKKMVAVKFPDAPIEVVPKGAGFAFADPQLEALTPVEKHILRMGPQNGKAVQSALESFARQAGIKL